MTLSFFGKMDRLPKGAVGVFSSFPTYCTRCREVTYPCRCLRNLERQIKRSAPNEA